MVTYCFNNEFICIFILLYSCIFYFYDERCKINFAIRDNKVLLYCIVMFKLIPKRIVVLPLTVNKNVNYVYMDPR